MPHSVEQCYSSTVLEFEDEGFWIGGGQTSIASKSHYSVGPLARSLFQL